MRIRKTEPTGQGASAPAHLSSAPAVTSSPAGPTGPHDAVQTLTPDKMPDVGGVAFGQVSMPKAPAALVDYARANLARNLPEVGKQKPNGRTLAIVGSGPSLEPEKIQADRVWAVNGAHDYLIGAGTKPDALVLADCQLEPVARFLKAPQTGVLYLPASMVHPKNVARLADAGFQTQLWHANNGLRPLMNREDLWWIASAGSCALTAVGLAELMGYREIHFHGIDASFANGTTHIDRDELKPGDLLQIEEAGRLWATCPQMVYHVKAALYYLPFRVRAGIRFKFFGDGLMQAVVKARGVLG